MATIPSVPNTPAASRKLRSAWAQPARAASLPRRRATIADGLPIGAAPGAIDAGLDRLVAQVTASADA